MKSFRDVARNWIREVSTGPVAVPRGRLIKWPFCRWISGSSSSSSSSRPMADVLLPSHLSVKSDTSVRCRRHLFCCFGRQLSVFDGGLPPPCYLTRQFFCPSIFYGNGRRSDRLIASLLFKVERAGRFSRMEMLLQLMDGFHRPFLFSIVELRTSDHSTRRPPCETGPIRSSGRRGQQNYIQREREKEKELYAWSYYEYL